MEKNNIWVIIPKTNLHVGNENTSSYGLIDLAIQRNAVTEIPCINSSSLKGAIKEYVANTDSGIDNNGMVAIFGSDKVNKDNTQKGNYTFFDAELVAISVPDDNTNKGYKLMLCTDALQSFIDKAFLLGVKNINFEEIKSVINPDGEVNMKQFKDYCSDDNLPIIARNVLEHGESKNLWYEQVLPAESVLLTIIDGKGDTKIDDALKKGIVQIGANASIGYGYCKFENIK